MALIKFGGGIAQMSGSIAGNTFSRNRYGAYARNRTKPVDPASVRQLNARAIVQSVVEAWTTALTAAQRTAWATYANALNFSNRLGESMKLTGFNCFVQSNAAHLNAGLSLVEDGPTELILPGADEAVVATYDESSNNLSLAFDNTKEWAGEVGGYMLVYMGEPQAATRNFFKGNYRYAGKISGAGTPPTSPATLASLPFTLTAGQKIWTKCRIVRADGRVSSEFSAAPVEVVA